MHNSYSHIAPLSPELRGTLNLSVWGLKIFPLLDMSLPGTMRTLSGSWVLRIHVHVLSFISITYTICLCEAKGSNFTLGWWACLLLVIARSFWLYSAEREGNTVPIICRNRHQKIKLHFSKSGPSADMRTWGHIPTTAMYADQSRYFKITPLLRTSSAVVRGSTGEILRVA